MIILMSINKDFLMIMMSIIVEEILEDLLDDLVEILQMQQFQELNFPSLLIF